MYGLLSTAAISSMRPPMLAGPIPRQTKRLSIGSVDQLTGVGVGLGIGVAVPRRDGAGLLPPAGGGGAPRVFACAPHAPHPPAPKRSAPNSTLSPPQSPAQG